MNIESITEARDRFDSEVHTEEYRKIHSDSDHLENLLELLEIENDKQYLDLGTGNGYLAFEIADRFKSVVVEGLDIAMNSISQNNSIALKSDWKNVNFSSYEGIQFPYDDAFFKGVISRYALHHFPEIENSIREINRVLEKDGFFLLSDPLTHDEDKEGFIDKFQKLKKDGHIHFYYEQEIVDHFEKQDFRKEKVFYSSVRFPRDYNSDYEDLLNGESKDILDLYEVEKQRDKVYITVKVMNILFRKTK